MKRSNKTSSDVQLLVLASLDDGPKHGHAIGSTIAETYHTRLGLGALYGALKRLTAKGWIEPLPIVGRRQPYTLTTEGKETLKNSLMTLRRLADSTPEEQDHTPSYYIQVQESAIQEELANEPTKPQAYDADRFPFVQLGGRRFEVLTYLVKRNDEGTNGIVTLLKGSRDGGRDVLVHRSSRLAAVIQCKNLGDRLSLLAIQEELLKLILHDYRESFIPAEGIDYELWAPSGWSEDAEVFITTGRGQFTESAWKEIFNRITKKYKKLSSLQWDEVRQYVQASLSDRIRITAYEAVALTHKLRPLSELCSQFFTVLNVWKKDDVEQILNPTLQKLGVQLEHLTSLTEGNADNEIDEQINDARDLINNGDFSEAQTVLRLLKRKKGHLFSNRQSFRVISNEGAIAFSDNRLEDAAQMFLQAARLEPNDDKAKENEVFAYYLLGDIEKAHRLATERREDMPTSARMAGLWVNSASASTPLAELESVLDTKLKEEHEVAIALARRCMAEHLLEKAEQYVEAAKISAPKWSQPWLTSAHIVLAKMLEENAGLRRIPKEDRSALLQSGIEAATKSINLSAKDGSWAKAEALCVRSQLHLMRDELTEATADAKAAYLLESDSLSTLLTLAQTLLGAGSLEQAIDILTEAFRKEARPDVALMYSKALAQRNKGADLQNASDAAKNIDISSIPRLMRVGVATHALMMLSRLSNWDGADAYLQKVEASLDTATILTLRAGVEHRKGNNDVAEKIALEALEGLAEDTSAQTKELLGHLFLSIDRAERALPILQELFDNRIPTFDPRQLLLCASRLHDDANILKVCDELHLRGPVPWDVLEFEIQTLERYDYKKAIERIREYLALHPGDKLALLRMSSIGANQGLSELVHARLEELPAVDELPVEYLMPALGILRLGPDAEHAIDYAYRFLRLHFDRKEAHEAFIQIVISRADREAEPDLEAVVAGAAVYTEERYSGQPRWFVLEDTETPVSEFEEITPKDPKTAALLGRKVGDTVVLATASMGNREAIVKKILPKFVRRFQDCMSELQVRFGPSTMIQSVHIGDPNDISQPGLMSMMTSVRKRAELISKLKETYVEQPLMSLHLYGEPLGKNSYETLQHLATSDETIKCASGDTQEAERALSLLRERPGLLLDLSAIATVRLLGLEWMLSTKAHRFCMTQNTWEELRSTLIPNTISPGKSATMIYQAGGYALVEDDASAKAAREAEDKTFLDSIQSNVEVIAATELAALTPETRETLVKYLGQYGAETVATAPGANLVIWSDDGSQAVAAQHLLNAKRVWTQVVLLSLVEAGVIQKDDYTRAVAKLVGMGYTSTFFDADCILECTRMAEYRPSRFPLKQMIDSFATSGAAAEGLIGTFLRFFVLLQQEPLLFQKRSYVINTFFDALWSNPNTHKHVTPLRQMASRLFGLNVIAETEFCTTFDAWVASVANRKIG